MDTLRLLPLLALAGLAPPLFPQTVDRSDAAGRPTEGSGTGLDTGLRSEEDLKREGWFLLDAVIAQAGDDVVTLGNLDDFLTERLGPDATQEIAQANAPRALQTLEMIRLETQAGEDLGIPREEIERIIQANLDERRRESGVLQFRDDLAAQGLDPRSAIDSQSAEFYRIVWTREQLGRASAAGRRVVRDPYLRPGTLRAFYHENQDLLGDPPQVRFQRIFLAVRPDEDVAQAELRARGVIERLGKGESFEDLLLSLGEEDPIDSLQPWQDLPDLAAESPEVAAFARRAAEGSIYPEPLPAFVVSSSGAAPSQPVGWFIYRLNDRIAGNPPPFNSRETQNQLRRLLSERWSDSALARARAKLEATSYRWRHSRFGGAPTPELIGPPRPGE